MTVRTVWVTRAEPGAAKTAERLRARGLEPVVAPLLATEALPFHPAVADAAAALAFTSSNGVDYWVGGGGRTDLPAFAVGNFTAEKARQRGFKACRASDGGVDALARRIIGERPSGRVLHVGAREPAGDLVGALTAAGVQASGVAVYAGRETALQQAPDTDAVLLHSPRAARALATLAPGDDRLAACLSEAVAAPLRAAGFARVATADCPNEDALLRLLSA